MALERPQCHCVLLKTQTLIRQVQLGSKELTDELTFRACGHALYGLQHHAGR